MRRHANAFKHRASSQRLRRVGQSRSLALASGRESLVVQGKEARGTADA